MSRLVVYRQCGDEDVEAGSCAGEKGSCFQEEGGRETHCSETDFDGLVLIACARSHVQIEASIYRTHMPSKSCEERRKTILHLMKTA